jgi:cytoskeletal protein RodZ
MIRFTLVILAAPFLLGAETPASPEKAKTPAPAAKQITPPAAPTAAGAAGMVVVKDPETGELRAPNAQEAAALNPGGAASPSGFRIASPQPEEITSPVGQFPGVRLNDTANVYSVATIGPDGKLKMQCIDEKSKAESAVKAGTTPKPVLPFRKETQLELQ